MSSIQSDRWEDRVILWHVEIYKLSSLNVGQGNWMDNVVGNSKIAAILWIQLGGCEFEQAPGAGDGQGSLACCSPWGLKESDTTERLNWTELNFMKRKDDKLCQKLPKRIKFLLQVFFFRWDKQFLIRKQERLIFHLQQIMHYTASYFSPFISGLCRLLITIIFFLFIHFF